MRAVGAVALGLALCLAAGAFGAAPLYVPGLALLLCAAAAAAWVWLAARTVHLSRSIDGLAVHEGSPLRVTVSVGRGRVPLPGATLRAFEGGPPMSLPRRGQRTATATIRLPRRGRHRLGPASVLLSDPLGLWRRNSASAPHDVLVLPRLEPVELVGLRSESAHGERMGAVLSASGAAEVDSLQPHRPGTPASRIHWPTTARTATLMERRLVAEGDEVPLVVVDPRGPASPEALDQAVRAAASLCAHLGRRGGCALLLGGDSRPARIDGELNGFPEAHARLALLEPSAGAPQLDAMANAGTVIWLTAASVPGSLPAGTAYVVSAQPQPGRLARFSVAGCRGYEVAHGTVRSV